MIDGASGWALRRTDTGAAVTDDGHGHGRGSVRRRRHVDRRQRRADVGDRLLIRRRRDAVADMQVLVSDPSRDRGGGADPHRRRPPATSATAPSRPAKCSTRRNAQLRSPVTITFTSATQYTISGDPTAYTYTPGANIDANGWRVQISGTPAAGDSFTVSDNTSGSGDNRNALLLAGVMTQPGAERRHDVAERRRRPVRRRHRRQDEPGAGDSRCAEGRRGRSRRRRCSPCPA